MLEKEGREEGWREEERQRDGEMALDPQSR